MAKLCGLTLSDVAIPDGFEQETDSPLVNFLLYVFTIEPSFYNQIRKITDDNEYGCINFLGPYIFCIYQILAFRCFGNAQNYLA